MVSDLQPYGDQQLAGYTDWKSHEDEDEQPIPDEENEINVVLMSA